MNKVEYENQTVFARDYNGKMSYSLAIASKGWEDGHETDELITFYMPVQFSKGNAPRGEKPKLDMKGWLTTFKDRDGNARLKFVVTNWQYHQSDSFGA